MSFGNFLKKLQFLAIFREKMAIFGHLIGYFPGLLKDVVCFIWDIHLHKWETNEIDVERIFDRV